MTDIVVERHWDPAVSGADILLMAEAAGGCLEIHRCNWHGSLLSVDGRELVCHFTARDAESVRLALRDAHSPRGDVWVSSIHEPPGTTRDDVARANVLVTRRFEEPVAFADLQAREEAGAGCLETHRVRFVRTYFSADHRRMICLYQAPDAESVRIAQREAGMPVERVWAFQQFRP